MDCLFKWIGILDAALLKILITNLQKKHKLAILLSEKVLIELTIMISDLDLMRNCQHFSNPHLFCVTCRDYRLWHTVLILGMYVELATCINVSWRV